MDVDCTSTSISLSNDAKWTSVERRFPDLWTHHGMEEENVNVGGVSADNARVSKAPEKPMADARNFQPGFKLSGDMHFENNPGTVR